MKQNRPKKREGEARGQAPRGRFRPTTTLKAGPRTCRADVRRSHETAMNLDDQVRRYFGVSDLAAVQPEALNAGLEHMKVDLGLTNDRGERFALWALLHTLGSAPDLDVVFETEADRDAARNFMDLIQGATGQ